MSIVEKAVGHAESGRKKVVASALGDESQAELDAKRDQEESIPSDSPASRQDPSDIVLFTAGFGDQDGCNAIENPILSREFRFLKRPILARVFGRPGSAGYESHIVSVTSALPGAGKSFMAFNLAISLAQEQMLNVILIDADALRRNLTVTLGRKDRKGLLETLSDANVSPDAYLLNTDIPSLRFLPAGQPREDSSELLGGRRLTEVLTALDSPDTVVLLDSPPVLLTSESRVIDERSDHTLVVIEAGKTSQSEAASVLKALQDTKSSISFILNKSPTLFDRSQMRYSGYGYGAYDVQT